MLKAPFSIQVRTMTGLEPVLQSELLALGAQSIEPGSRIVLCQGDLELLYRINIHCRVATRVIVPIHRFEALDEKSFYEGVKKINWSEWLGENSTLAVDTLAFSSFSTHSLYISQLTKDAVVDQFRENGRPRPSVDLDNPSVRISVRLSGTEAEIALDSSGSSLHKRGYRMLAGEAPLSEVLAAGMLSLSGWSAEKSLLDPMCGSGTLPIEAALMARNIAPGLIRPHFGFQTWPNYDAALFERLLETAKQAILGCDGLSIRASDIDSEMVERARRNAEIAGVLGDIQFEVADFFSLKAEDTESTKHPLVVLNPPYDERLLIDNLAELYQRIGDHLKQHFAHHSAYILSGNLDAIRYIGLRPSKRIRLFNGAIECRLLEFLLRPAASKEGVRRERTIPDKWKIKAEEFGNRIRKNLRRYGKWAKREKIDCWRVYDWDIPEFAFLIDVFADHLHFAELERNFEGSPIEHSRYVRFLATTACEILGIPTENLHMKKRRPQQKGARPYIAPGDKKEWVQVQEGGHRFWTNFDDYLDVGLFLDHRKTRSLVQKESAGKDVLNLFSYTGSFTVYAAKGGAKSTTTVDTSQTYLEWAKRNLELNEEAKADHEVVRSDAMEYLSQTNKRFDLCVVDPPSKSVQQSMGRRFHVQDDYIPLLRSVCRRMRKGGKIYFSTNYRAFEMDPGQVQALVPGLQSEEITAKTVPMDFKRHPSHRCWLLNLPN